jgi:type II secretory pathway pseudopilin PulG
MRFAVSARRAGERGYTLLMLTFMLAVLTVTISVALPYWSKQAQREQEEELIFRGLQYAEAIRIFRNRFGRLPVKLEELYEVKPRSIRKLWKDPMTESGAWTLVFEGANPAGGQLPPGQAPPPQLFTVPEGDEDGDGNGRIVTTGPIAGVVSKSDKEAMQIFQDKERHDEWQFTYQLLTAPAGFGVPNDKGGGSFTGLTVQKAEWIGRPFRPGIVPPGGAGPGGPTGLIDGTGVDGKPIPRPGSGSSFGGKPAAQPRFPTDADGDED